MANPTSKEAFAYEQFIKPGVFEIREDGTIWRNKIVYYHGKDFRMDSIAPRRAETINRETGYYRLATKIDGRYVTVQAHRLVFYHFFGEIPEDKVINHKNGVKTDNHPDNLEAITHRENMTHMREVLKRWSPPPRNRHLFGMKHPNSRLTPEEVIEIRNELRNGSRIREVARKLNRSVTMVAMINAGTTYRDVLEEKPVSFPISVSKYHRNKNKVIILQAKDRIPFYDVCL